MGWRYGVKRIMSSYDFEDSNRGPPTQSLPEDWFTATILPPTTSAGSSDLGETQAIGLVFRLIIFSENINYDQDRDVYFGCDNGWICEHRWPGTDFNHSLGDLVRVPGLQRFQVLEREKSLLRNSKLGLVVSFNGKR